jgi:two-component system LytT family sensor kinase
MAAIASPAPVASSDATPLTSRSGFWMLQLGGWLAFVAILMLPWIGAYPVGPMLARKLPLAITGFLTTLALRAIYRRLLRRDTGMWLLVGMAVPASYAGARLWTAVADQLAHLMGPDALSESGVIRAALTRVNDSWYYALVLITWSLLYVGITRHAALQHERERALHAEARAHRARLDALRYQVNPHFLFNTLNAISTLVLEQRTPEAGRMIARLSDFLRITLQERSGDVVSLGEEIAFVSKYLEIEQVRFGSRLQVRVQLPEAISDASVPTMILQPVVENAIRHGVSQDEAGGALSIAAERLGPALRITVENAGGTIGTAGGLGIGLANVRARLRELHGDAGSVALETLGGSGARVTIELPFEPYAR